MARIPTVSRRSISAYHRDHPYTIDVEGIRAVTRSFGELDNRFGGGDIRPAVVRYLDGSVTPLLRDGSYGEPVGRLLASAAGVVQRRGGP